MTTQDMKGKTTSLWRNELKGFITLKSKFNWIRKKRVIGENIFILFRKIRKISPD